MSQQWTAPSPFAAAAGRSNRAVQCLAVCTALVAAALAAPAVARAHPRTATVALDYRLTIDRRVPGVQVHVLDGDRALRVTAGPGTRLVVLGDLGEPMLRFGDGIWVNEASPTAEANKLVTRASKGWRSVSHGRTYAWHEHRLSPPPYRGGDYGAVARWTVPVLVDGRRSAIGGAFVRVARPRLLGWAVGVAIAIALGVLALRRRPKLGLPLTVASGAVAGAAALVANTAFALRDSPSGHVGWVAIGIAAAVAAAAIWLLVVGTGSRRGYVAGAIGAGVAALTLSWLGVFLHGAVVAALPGAPVRFACAVAFGGGVLALVGSLSLHAEDVR